MMRMNLQVFQVLLPCVVGQIAPRIFFNIDVPLKDCLEFRKLFFFGANFCVCVHTSKTKVIVETYTKPIERKEKI